MKAHAYGNATWDDLIAILDAKSEEDLASFSDVWVNQKGMPHISFARVGKQLEIIQKDPYNRGLIWPQRFEVTLKGDKETQVEVNLKDSIWVMELPEETEVVLPNTDGRGYGLFIPDAASLAWLLKHWQETADDTARQSLLMLL